MIEVIEKQVGKKLVYIVEEHHHVLIPWAAEREKLGIAPHVLTLDHHTDTLPAYTHYDETHSTPHEKYFDRKSRNAIEQALQDLRHDEHFDLAVKNQIIASAAIFSHVNYARDVNPAVSIIHDPPKDETIETLGKYYALTLETEFLQKNLERAPLPQRPFILDIDLDCFKGEKSIAPQDKSIFLKLIRDASAITISRERDWVRLLNMDYGHKLFDYFEEKLLAMIKCV